MAKKVYRENHKYITKWTARKRRNLLLAVKARLADKYCSKTFPKWYFHNGYCANLGYNFRKASSKLANCGTFINTLSDSSRSKHLVFGSTRCQYRYCNICQMLKARKLSDLMTVLFRYELHFRYPTGTRKHKLIFVTLTTPDVYLDFSNPDVPRYVRQIKQGRAKLRRYVSRFINSLEVRGWNSSRKHYHGVALGCITKYEYTYRIDYQHSKGIINLHCHVPMEVHCTYGRGKHYYTKNQWNKIWRSACDNHVYNAFVEACYYKDKQGRKHYLKGNYSDDDVDKVSDEVGKYEGKADDMMKAGSKGLNHQIKILLSHKGAKKGQIKKAVNVLDTHVSPDNYSVLMFMALVLGFKGARAVQYYGRFKVARHLLSKGAPSVTMFNLEDKTVYSLNVQLSYSRSVGYSSSVSKISKDMALKVLYQFYSHGHDVNVQIANGKILNVCNQIDRLSKMRLIKFNAKRKAVHNEAMSAVESRGDYKYADECKKLRKEAYHQVNRFMDSIIDYGMTKYKRSCFLKALRIYHNMAKRTEVKPVL